MYFETTNLLMFIGASLVLILTPGPDMIYVITRGIAQGRLAAILSALGVCGGLIVHTLAAALGLAILLKTSTSVYYAIKYIGAVYLIYLGIKNLTSQQGITGIENKEQQSKGNLFIQGFLTNVLNPKVALFFVSFLPQFVDSRSPVAALQSVMLGFTYFLLCLGVLVFIAFLSGQLGRVLQRKENISRIIGWVSGSVLIGLGFNLALPGRN